MKKNLLLAVLLMCLAVPGGVLGEISHSVDEFDGSMSNTSMNIVATSYQKNTVVGLSLLNSSEGAYKTALLLSYFSDKSYIFSHSSMELKINNDYIVEAKYLYQESKYISYYPVSQITNIGLYDFSGDVAEQIINADSVKLRAYISTGDIVYTVPDLMLQEWKQVLSMPFISGYKSIYSGISWPQRGNDTNYCIDICDENWNVYEVLRGVQCGESREWSPKKYINRTLRINDGVLTGFKFNWRVWSESGYSGEGFEGSVICE